MSKISETYEYFYYDGNEESNGETDFKGETSVFDTEQRIRFLAHYADQARRWFDDEKLGKPVVPAAQLNEALMNIKSKPLPHKRKRTELKDFSYHTMGSERSGWKLYYKGAHLDGRQLILHDRHVPPVPCAKYVFDKRAESLRIGMEVCIDKSYITAGEDVHYHGSIGKTIELRLDTLHAAKIKFYCTGHVKAFGEDKWHPKSYDLGTFKPDEWVKLEFSMDFAKKVYSVTLGDAQLVRNIPFPCDCDGLNNLFFDGGMHPGGTWSIRNLYAASDSSESSQIVPMEPPAPEDTWDWLGMNYNDAAWEKTNLPFAIGGFDHRDQSLLLRKVFTTTPGKSIWLHLESLDPHGEVWINGYKVAETEDFQQTSLDITPHVHHGGDNLLAIRIYPRAPEVYYHWHRNSDSYHGWFSNRIYIEETEEVMVNDPIVRTLSLHPDGLADVECQMEVSNRSGKAFSGYLTVSAGKWFPVEESLEQQTELKVALSAGESKTIKTRFRMKCEYWHPDSPVLYQFKFEFYDASRRLIDDEVMTTGIRTIDQQGGQVRLNGKPMMLNGALLMQFLPPRKEIPINHVCPSTEQIVWQMLMIKKMNGNTARLHMLGYGTNDARFAEICDQLGVMLIWTTRYIDSLESIIFPGDWKAKEEYVTQIKQVINHPSIVMWEGSNEFHGNLQEIDKMYDEFVDAIRSVDPTRLLSPSSHVYYGGGLYGDRHQYYNDDGTQDQDGHNARSSSGWVSSHVVRSCHPYILLNGYGRTWDVMRKQEWSWQDELLNSQRHAYLITEFAITADPNWELQANEPWYKVDSYEKPYEPGSIGRKLLPEEWKESQAFQCFAAFQAIKRMRLAGADGMMWCCLSEGANDVTYRKPPIDFYGNAKLGFYGMKMGFQEVLAVHGNVDVVLGDEDLIHPVLIHCSAPMQVDLFVKVLREDGEVMHERSYRNQKLEGELARIDLEPFSPDLTDPGYYTVKFEVYKKE